MSNNEVTTLVDRFPGIDKILFSCYCNECRKEILTRRYGPEGVQAYEELFRTRFAL